jgi:transposase
LEAIIQAQQRQIEQLQVLVEQLQQQLAQALKNSSTSSKPPSSDLVKPAKTPSTDGTPKRLGAQPGHKKHTRQDFPPEQVTAAFEHLLSGCPDCGGALRQQLFARVVQQVDLQPPVLTVQQHTCPSLWCDHCGRSYQAPLPEPIRQGGLVGPRLTALIGYLKGVCHASFSTVRKFLKEVVGVTISRGQLAKVLTKVTRALEGPYRALLDALPHESLLNVDETSHPENGQRLWTWCFRADLYTVFKVSPSRGADVLLEVLGREFDGVLGCDCFSAYRRFMREVGIEVQFCLAHLIRDVKYLTTLPDAATRAYGERLREALRELFVAIHASAGLSAESRRGWLLPRREAVLFAGTRDVPPTEAALAMQKRLTKYGEKFFTFITTPGMEPTNNVAEQAIRFVVIDRHITQGTRGEKGRAWCERIWTVIASCAQQSLGVWGVLEETVEAWFQGREPATRLATA